MRLGWMASTGRLPSKTNGSASPSAKTWKTTSSRPKRLDSYVYSFVTKSGLNEIVAITVDGAVDKNVGVLLEDAMVSMAYKDFPRLYVVDSSEGIVWVIDLLTDTVVDSIL